MDEAKLNATHDVTAREVALKLDAGQALIEQHFKSLEAMIDERFLSRDIALKHQADEYERRLETLNHAHQQAVEVQQTYVQQDYYTAQHKSLEITTTSGIKEIAERVSRLEKDTSSVARVNALEDMLREKSESMEKSMRDRSEALEKANREKLAALEISVRERVEAIDRASDQRYSSLSKIVWMMIGGLIVIQLILKFVPIGK